MSRAILCIHGIGREEAKPAFRPSWDAAIRQAMGPAGPQARIDFLDYDDIFAAQPPGGLTYARALLELAAGWIGGAVEDALRPRGLLDLPERVKWTAGMVAQWVVSDAVRRQTRRRLAEAMTRHAPDLILAHSLGSLIAYDTFARGEGRSLLAGRVLVTFGSQLGHRAVRRELGGRIEALADARRWYHLFNERDHVFTEPLHLAADNFRQVLTPFDIESDPFNHDAPAYLTHPATRDALWSEATAVLPRRLAGLAKGVEKTLRATAAKPRRRALLVGIDDYPDPANRLDGCVNDVYLVSALLQESGFEAADIRIVLDGRATARAVRDRLHWLLDGSRPGDERLFYYSGHGAQMPAYGAAEEVDRFDECLVTHDFDWTAGRAIADNAFHDLYSQLPYEARFLAILDCCHSGGMARDGARRIKGLAPPDDIRHRALAWRAQDTAWGARGPFAGADSALARRTDGAAYLGASGATHRLGRAIALRKLESRDYDATRKAYGHRGPYLPVILEACREDQFAYEYRDGAASYGAFTYHLVKLLREARRQRRAPDLTTVVQAVGARLKALGYEQAPALVGAKRVLGKAGRMLAG